MKSNFRPVGDFIQLVDVRNSNSEVSLLLGMNINKEFMPSIANTSGTDLSKYKVIRKGQFAYSAMQTGRDETIRVAHYTDDEPAIISPAYSVFEVIDTSSMLPEFIMMWFLRPESDRYGWFISDGSVRASLEWERFCEIRVPVPPPDEQAKYVNIYQGLTQNQSCYEESLQELIKACRFSIGNFQDLISEDDFIGKYIRTVDFRNKESRITNVMGLNVKKSFMPTVANTSDTDLSNYKIIRKSQFAYSPMQVGRDETIRVALYTDEDPAIISPAYTVFEVDDHNVVLPEFLMAWFHRPEFNRYGWFLSDSSVRASLDWERFCAINVPTPNKEQQQSIANIYNALELRKKLNEKLKKAIRPLCPVLMQGVIHQLELNTRRA